MEIFAARFSIGPRLTWGQSERGRIKSPASWPETRRKLGFNHKSRWCNFLLVKKTDSQVPSISNRSPLVYVFFKMCFWPLISLYQPRVFMHSQVELYVISFWQHSRCWCLWHVPPVSRVKVPVQTLASCLRKEESDWYSYVLEGQLFPTHVAIAIVKWAQVLLVFWGRDTLKVYHIQHATRTMRQSGLNRG